MWPHFLLVQSIKRTDMSNDNTLTLTIRANTAALQAALKTAQANVQAFSKTVGNKFANNAVDMRDAFSRASGAIESTLKRVGAVALSGSFGLAAFTKSASELQSLRASFQSLTGTIENTNSVMNTLYQYGKETAFDNASIQASAKMFLANGVAVQDLMGWMRTLGDVAGATGADLKGLALPLTQAIGSGKMMTQDWYQMINQGAGGLQKYIIAAMGAGHSVKTFKEDLSAGAITTDVLRKALELAGAQGEMAFQGALRQSQTFNGRMSNLMEAITNVGLSIIGVDAATGQVNTGGIFDRISKSVENATTWLENNKVVINKVANTIINNLVPAVTALGSAWMVMKVGGGITNAIESVNKYKKSIEGTVSAFKLLSVALTGNPFMLIATAIAVVVSALVFLQMKFNIFGKAAEWIKNAWNKTFGTISRWVENNKKLLINLGIITGTILLPKIMQIGIKSATSFGKMAASAMVAGAKMAAQGTIAFGKWIAGSVIMGAKTVATFAMMGVHALLAGAKIAAAWLIAMGPVGLIVTIVAGVVALVIANWKKVSKWFSDFWKVLSSWLAGVWKGASETFGKVAVFVGDIVNKIGGFFKGVWGVVTNVFNNIVGFLAKWGPTILAIVFFPISILVGLFFMFKDQIFAIFSAIGEFICNAFSFAVSIITTVWGVVVAFFSNIWNGIISVFSTVVNWFGGVFSAAWNAIVMAWNAVVGWFAGVWRGIVGIFSVVAGWFTAVFQNAWNGIVNVWNGVVSFFSGVWNGIMRIFNVVGMWFSGVFKAAYDSIVGIFSGIGGFFQGIWNTITGIFGKVGTAIADSISGAVRGAVNSVLGFAENSINVFIRAINGAIDIINAIPGVNISKIQELRIPKLATGGIVTPQGGGSIIYAGDGGQNEWIIPESKMASLVGQINQRLNSGNISSGNNPVNITVNIETKANDFTDEDAVNIAQKINRALKAQGLRLDQLGALR